MSDALESLVLRAANERIDQIEKRIDALRPTWITVETYAERRSIAESTVRAAVKSGRLPAMAYGDTGRTYRVRADVEIGEPVVDSLESLARELSRYEIAAGRAGMTLRDFVVAACDAVVTYGVGYPNRKPDEGDPF